MREVGKPKILDQLRKIRTNGLPDKKQTTDELTETSELSDFDHDTDEAEHTKLHFFRVEPSSLPYFQSKAGNGEMINILIDTGSNKNYIKPRLAKKPIKNNQPFFVNSVGGKILITHHTIATFRPKKYFC